MGIGRCIELLGRARPVTGWCHSREKGEFRFTAALEATMPGRLIELAVRARRQLGGRGELTQFSFRLALVIDLAYIGLGALGGAALGRASAPLAPAGQQSAPACVADPIQRLH
jgi:hypothetical protein